MSSRLTTQPTSLRRASGLAALIAAGALAAAGCSSGPGTPAEAAPTDAPAAGAESATAPGAASAAKALEEGRTVIDVRTPEEFAEGHVEGATLMNIQDPGFAAQLAELDPDGTYVVYCRSGNRSAAAASQMRDAGLDVLDGGGLPTMVEAGWPAALTDASTVVARPAQP